MPDFCEVVPPAPEKLLSRELLVAASHTLFRHQNVREVLQVRVGAELEKRETWIVTVA